MLSTEWPEGGSRGKAKSAGTEVRGMKYAFKWKKCIGIRIFIDVLHPKCGLWEIMLISEQCEMKIETRNYSRIDGVSFSIHTIWLRTVI